MPIPSPPQGNIADIDSTEESIIVEAEGCSWTLYCYNDSFGSSVADMYGEKDSEIKQETLNWFSKVKDDLF